jgi:hypothetical protein
MSSNRRPPTLLEYLIEHDFAPVAEGTWFDHDTGDGIIRVVYQLGVETQLISLTPAICCRFKVMFYVGTPDAVIIAAVRAALRLPPDAGTQPSRAAPARGTATRDTSRRVPAPGKAGRDDHR